MIKHERQKFIDFGQIILWAICGSNVMINTLKYARLTITSWNSEP